MDSWTDYEQDYPAYGADSGPLADAILDTQDQNVQLWRENRRLKRKVSNLLWSVVTFGFMFTVLFLYAIGAGLYWSAIASGSLGVLCVACGMWGES